MSKIFKLVICLLAIIFVACNASNKDKDGWIHLFNGKNLDGWTPKFAGHKLGENYKDIFRVEGGLLKVSYDKLGKNEKYNNKFGHLFYKEAFSHYKLSITYRIVGQKQVKGAPRWAFRNSGVMIHCQDPKTMTVAQDFPVSIEVQFLGTATNGSLCTPGTHVVYKNKLWKPHVVKTNVKAVTDDSWVTVEVEVQGSEVIKHILNGKVALTYHKPQYDFNSSQVKPLLAKGLVSKDKPLIKSGYISLQSESHPIEFKEVKIKLLK